MVVVPTDCSGAVTPVVVEVSVCRVLPAGRCVVSAVGAVVVPEGIGSVVVAAADAVAVEDSSGWRLSVSLQAGSSSSNVAAHIAPAMRCTSFIQFHPLLLYRNGWLSPQSG